MCYAGDSLTSRPQGPSLCPDQGNVVNKNVFTGYTLLNYFFNQSFGKKKQQKSLKFLSHTYLKRKQLLTIENLFFDKVIIHPLDKNYHALHHYTISRLLRSWYEIKRKMVKVNVTRWLNKYIIQYRTIQRFAFANTPRFLC